MAQTTLPPDPEKHMSFFSHLDELRQRIMVSLVVFLVGFAISFFWLTEWIMEVLKQPLFQALPEDQRKLYFTGLFENFFAHLKVAGYSTIILFSPFFLYQIWGFAAPGLKESEKRLVIPFFVGAAGFFALGASFAYFILFPIGFKYFATFGSPTDQAMFTIGEYYSTCLKLLLLFGLAFELPVILVVLGYFGLIDSQFLITHRKNAIIGITLLSAVVAPPDAISMVILMCPLILLFETSIVVIRWIEKARHKNLPAETRSPLDGESR